MTEWKAVHWKESVRRFADGELVYPHLIQMDPVAACNHDCPFCSYRYRRDDDFNALMDFKDIIPYESVVSILDDGVEMGVKAVEITGGGEPSLHPEFAGVLAAVLDRNLELGVITNGAGVAFRRDPERIVTLLGESEWVRFSINGGTPTSYRAVHDSRRDDFERVQDNIAGLVQLGKEGLIVGISFIVQHENYVDIEDIVQLGNRLGVNYVRIAPALIATDTPVATVDYNYYTPDIVERVETDLARMKSVDWDGMEIIDVFTRHQSSRMQDVGYYGGGDFCYVSCIMAVIGADMRLYPCCIFKYRPDGVIGDLREVSFKALWEGTQRRTYYDNLDIEEMCGTCYLKPKNDLLKALVADDISEYVDKPGFREYMAEENPVHISFV